MKSCISSPVLYIFFCSVHSFCSLLLSIHIIIHCCKLGKSVRTQKFVHSALTILETRCERYADVVERRTAICLFVLIRSGPTSVFVTFVRANAQNKIHSWIISPFKRKIPSTKWSNAIYFDFLRKHLNWTVYSHNNTTHATKKSNQNKRKPHSQNNQARETDREKYTDTNNDDIAQMKIVRSMFVCVSSHFVVADAPKQAFFV